MVCLFSAAEMREADRLAAESGVPGIRLMENAGRAVAEVAARLAQPGVPGVSAPRMGPFDPRPSGPITILAGKGSNGGDGLVAARYLAHRGLDVEVILAEPGETFRGDALANLKALVEGGFARPRVFAGPSSDLSPRLAGSAVVIDALLGTGAKGAPRGPAAALIGLLNETGGLDPTRRPLVLSVDLPSGLDADTGQAPGPCVRADATVALGGIKLGLVLPEAAGYVGRLYLAPIGLPEACLGRPSTHWLLPGEAAVFLPIRPRAGHKGTFGHVWIVAGSPGYTGAAVLAGLGALRSGSGLATVVCPEGCREVVATALPELLTRGLPQGSDGRLPGAAAGDLALVLAGTGLGVAPGDTAGPGTTCEAARKASLVIGPGLGATPDVTAFVAATLRGPGRRLPVVLDADALNAMALAGPEAVTGFLASEATTGRASASLAGGASPSAARIVVTPHPGEMARLTGLPTATIQADRLGTARRAAAAWGVVVVLKGAGTVVASPDGQAWVNATGNPAMASAGSGDVLAGAIGSLLAQGCSPLEAALAGVSAHGLAGDLAAREIGGRGLLASDIAHRLPRALEAMTGPGGEYGPVAVELPLDPGNHQASDPGCRWEALHRPTWAEISLDAVTENARRLVNLAAPAGVMAVVKADAYGHGAVECARAVLDGGAVWLGVAALEEAIELRRADIVAPILILSASIPVQAEAIVAHDLTAAVFDLEAAGALAAAGRRLGRTARVHLKVDTGMGRLGVTPDQEGVELAVRLLGLDGLALEGVYTHFATSDEADTTFTRRQAGLFNVFLERCDRVGLAFRWRHAANSAGLMGLPETAHNLVRVGITLYGIYPSDEVDRSRLDLIPAMTWKSRLVQVKVVPAGAPISYGREHVTDHPTRIGTLPLGYADGYRRILSGRGRVLVRGVSCPVLGRVCMDHFMVCLDTVPEARPGDEVVLMGRQTHSGGPSPDSPAFRHAAAATPATPPASFLPPVSISAEELAATCQTISYDIVSAVGRRVPRVFLRDGRPVAVRSILGRAPLGGGSE
jgi:alanine racemase